VHVEHPRAAPLGAGGDALPVFGPGREAAGHEVPGVGAADPEGHGGPETVALDAPAQALGIGGVLGVAQPIGLDEQGGAAVGVPGTLQPQRQDQGLAV